MTQQAAGTSISLIVVGSGGVGKSALTLSFMYDEFIEDYEPTKADSYQKDLNIGNKTVSLNILDTAGQDGYVGVQDNFYRKSEGFMLVFDLTEKNPFDVLREFLERIIRVKNTNELIIILVGNKEDLTDKRQVSYETASAFAKEHGIEYIETSAKLHKNVDEAFHKLALDIFLRKQQAVQPVQSDRKKYSRKRFRCGLL